MGTLSIGYFLIDIGRTSPWGAVPCQDLGGIRKVAISCPLATISGKLFFGRY